MSAELELADLRTENEDLRRQLAWAAAIIVELGGLAEAQAALSRQAIAVAGTSVPSPAPPPKLSPP